jgi:hypothetical protein
LCFFPVGCPLYGVFAPTTRVRKISIRSMRHGTPTCIETRTPTRSTCTAESSHNLHSTTSSPGTTPYHHLVRRRIITWYDVITWYDAVTRCDAGLHHQNRTGPISRTPRAWRDESKGQIKK